MTDDTAGAPKAEADTGSVTWSNVVEHRLRSATQQLEYSEPATCAEHRQEPMGNPEWVSPVKLRSPAAPASLRRGSRSDNENQL